MLYLQPYPSQTYVTSLMFVRNCVRSSLFLVFLILASLPLSLFALLCWTLELQTTTED